MGDFNHQQQKKPNKQKYIYRPHIGRNSLAIARTDIHRSQWRSHLFREHTVFALGRDRIASQAPLVKS